MTSPRLISVVIPVYNEEKVFDELWRRLQAARDALGNPTEIIFVDDGSTDQTFERIRETAVRYPGVKYVSFSRNFGHQPAVAAGIHAAKGEAVVVLDGDLQDPPELICEFIKKWNEGWQVVYGIRRKRKENFLRRAAYRGFYQFIQSVSDVPMPRDAGDFCLMDRRVADIIRKAPERSLYIRGMRAWAGFKQTGIEYERDRRFAGKTKYSWSKMFRFALDGLTGFSQFPLRLSGYLGFGMAVTSFGGLLYCLASKWMSPQTPRGWTSLTFAIFFLGGVQLIMLSLMGSYIGRIYAEVKYRPLYVVRESNLHESIQP